MLEPNDDLKQTAKRTSDQCWHLSTSWIKCDHSKFKC